MASKAGPIAPKPGLDRNRIGERLEASVAGLQELRLLRERHEETVRRVLSEAQELEAGSERLESPADLQPPGGAGDRETLLLDPEGLHRASLQDLNQRLSGPEDTGDQSDDGPRVSALLPTTGRQEVAGEPGEPWRGNRTTGGVAGHDCPPRPGNLASEEVRGRLWKKDVSGDQAGEGERCGTGASVTPTRERLELDKMLGSEAPVAERVQDNGDSDSRPSSGFYEVSDSASGSLSNSYTSVYSECPSGSRWSVQSSSQLPWHGAGRNRPRSTDDTVRPTGLSAQRPLGLGEGCGLGRTGKRRKGSQRPVSAGELTFLCRYPGNPRLSSGCPSGSLPDPRFCCDLVSRSGSEVYPYPSPLHAVALQSPLFTASSSSCLRPREEEPVGAKAELSPGPGTCPWAGRERLDRYICGLVLRFRRGASADLQAPLGRPPLASHPKSLSLSSVYSQSSSTAGGVPLTSPAGAWKGRRRISTSCHVATDGARVGGEAAPSPPAPESAGEQGPLYRGKHLHRELVRCPATGAEAPAGEQGDVREKDRKAELFKRLSNGRSSASRSTSEMNLTSAALQRPDGPLGLQCRLGQARRKQKWTSVLEIPAPGRPKKSGFLEQAQAFLSRHQRGPSADSPPHSPGQSSGWPRGAETLPRSTPVSETRFNRSKSFKELRRKVQLSIRPWSLKVNNTPK